MLRHQASVPAIVLLRSSDRCSAKRLSSLRCSETALKSKGVRSALNARQQRQVSVTTSQLSSSETSTGGYMKLENAMRDDWVLMKDDGTRLETNPSDIDKYLRTVGLDSVPPAEVGKLLEDGYTLIDTRIQWSYDEWHLKEVETQHLPIYREIIGSSPIQTFRKMGFALFVEFPPTERNFPEWLEEVQARVSRDAKVILACDTGGLLSPEPSRRIFSPSLEAAFYLKHLGYTDVVHLQGGFCNWRDDQSLLASTKFQEDLPWYKRVSGVKEFFPRPCGYPYVQRCAKCTLDEPQIRNKT